jgi:hypothetical protein
VKESTVVTLGRRSFLKALAAGTVFSAVKGPVATGKSNITQRKNVSMIHATDLYRPHMDPDDHWDLACVFALCYRGDVDLQGILIDFPPNSRQDINPDVAAVSQMNFITGKRVPVVVGSSIAMRTRDDVQPSARPTDLNGVRMVLDILKNSTKPVVINTTGSCRDIAIAANKEPTLFSKKCAGVYLNAGTGSPKRDKATRLEYNVTLDRSAYAAIFDLPCPVYWMPCFEEIEPQGERGVMEYGTYYRFRQDAILPHLSDKTQNFFAYMLGRMVDHNWLNYLTGDKDQALLDEFGAKDRNMWCTGGFFHAAGYTVTVDGEIVPLEQAGNKAVFEFESIQVSCTESGVTTWSYDSAAKNRYIFHIRDTKRYQSAMTKAMKTLLMELP